MTQTEIDKTRVISLYETFHINGREVMRMIAQSLFSEARLEAFKARAKEGTFAAFDRGRYDYQQEVYLHPINSQKPYLDKFKQSIINQ